MWWRWWKSWHAAIKCKYVVGSAIQFWMIVQTSCNNLAWCFNPNGSTLTQFSFILLNNQYFIFIFLRMGYHSQKNDAFLLGDVGSCFWIEFGLVGVSNQISLASKLQSFTILYSNFNKDGVALLLHGCNHVGELQLNVVKLDYLTWVALNID